MRRDEAMRRLRGWRCTVFGAHGALVGGFVDHPGAAELALHFGPGNYRCLLLGALLPAVMWLEVTKERGEIMYAFDVATPRGPLELQRWLDGPTVAGAAS